MAFGNYQYPNYYSPNYTQPVYQNPIPLPAQQSSNGIVWVQGEAGAKAYPVAPNNSVFMMDTDAKTFYIKSADQSGMPTMRTFDYAERITQQDSKEQQKVDYVTREEFGKLVSVVKAMREGNANEQSDI